MTASEDIVTVPETEIDYVKQKLTTFKMNITSFSFFFVHTFKKRISWAKKDILDWEDFNAVGYCQSLPSVLWTKQNCIQTKKVYINKGHYSFLALTCQGR